MMINDLKVAFASVKGALRRRGRSKQDAEDLVQEAFLRLLSYERGHTVANPDAFLMTAALNLSIDTYRTHLRRGEEVLLDTVLLVDTAPGLEDVLLSRERVRRLRTGLARLDETTRTIFLAHRLDGMSYREIGLLEGVSIGSVERHVIKAVLLITEWMEGWYP